MSKVIMINRPLVAALGIMIAALVSVSSAGAQAGAPGAAVSAHRYNGVASCASSNCHGGAAPRQTSSVLQNEYVTWSKHDRHSKAYQSLLGAEGKRIGMHLGITAPEKEEWCLRCHSTFVADQKRVGDEFRAEDGVGCESCHGASGGYLKEHAAAGATLTRNLELGLVNLTKLETRAGVCVDCHYGSDKADVTHRLMGAGHPRLSFELDTFTALQPMHWRIDQDYKDRKGEYSPARAWMIGQFAVARAMTNRYGSPDRTKVHAWPELTLLSCYSCHHSLTPNQWKSAEYAGQPGELRLNVSAFAMIRRMLGVFSKERAAEFGTVVAELVENFKRERLSDSVSPLNASLEQSQKFLLSQPLDAEALRRLMISVLDGGLEMPLLQYEDAEQVTMGLSALLSERSPDGKLHQAEMKGVYDSLRSPSEFVAADFRAASERFREKLK